MRTASPGGWATCPPLLLFQLRLGLQAGLLTPQVPSPSLCSGCLCPQPGTSLFLSPPF